MTYRQRDLVRATAWMGLALVSFVGIAVGARELLDTMYAFQILFIRSALGLGGLILCGLAFQPGFHRSGQLRLHGLRNLFHFGGQACWITAIGSLPMAVVFALEFTTPIWAAILAALFLAERLTAGRLMAIALGFLGVLVIVRPGLAAVDPAIFIGLAAALGFAVSLTTTKRLTRDDRPLTILFYMALIQLGLGVLPAALSWQPLAWGDLPWLLLVAFCGVSAHYGITRAFLHAEAMVVVPIDFLRLPLIAVVGWLFYDEGLDPLVFAGAALIVAGTYFNLLREARRR